MPEGRAQTYDAISSSNDKQENVRRRFVSEKRSVQRIYNPYSKISKQVSAASQCSVSEIRGLHWLQHKTETSSLSRHHLPRESIPLSNPLLNLRSER